MDLSIKLGELDMRVDAETGSLLFFTNFTEKIFTEFLIRS